MLPLTGQRKHRATTQGPSPEVTGWPLHKEAFDWLGNTLAEACAFPSANQRPMKKVVLAYWLILISFHGFGLYDWLTGGLDC